MVGTVLPAWYQFEKTLRLGSASIALGPVQGAERRSNETSVAQAELKQLLSSDAPEGIETYRPADPNDFALHIQALVGPVANDGKESFEFTVATPAWLASHAGAGKGFAFLRHILLVESWDSQLVDRAIGDLVRNTSGADWNEIATKLSRFGAWEFED